MSTLFSRDAALGEVLLKWWKGLETDRASRAILRRAPSISEVVMRQSYQTLHRRLCGAGWQRRAKPHQNDCLAAVAGLLAHVRYDNGRSFPQAASGDIEDAKVAGPKRPPVSELRFLRLLESPDIDTLFVGLRRVLPLIGHGIGVVELANDVVEWGDRDDVVRKRWAYQYDWPDKAQ